MVKKFSEVIQNIREVKEPTGKLKDTCWKGYTAVGMKMKNGRKVPNCVPVGEQFASDKPEQDREAVGGRFTSAPAKSVQKPAPQATPKNEEVELDEAKKKNDIDLYQHKDLYNKGLIPDREKKSPVKKKKEKMDFYQHKDLYNKGLTKEDIEQIEEMPGANMDTRAVHKHLRKSGWSLTRTKGSHDVYTHPKSEKHIAVPRHKQLKAPLVRGIMKDAQVSEDIEQIEEKRPGLWANIHAKRARGERMRKPGEKGAPTEAQLKSARNEEVEQVEESRGHKILATKLAQIDARKQREAEAAKRAAEEQKKKEPVKEDSKGAWQKDTGWKKDKGDAVDKSGAKHSAMSRAKHLAKMASRKKVLEQDNNNQVDNVQTPAKKSLAFRGVVKNVEKPTKGKKLSGDDKFEPEPELNTQIMRNNF